MQSANALLGMFLLLAAIGLYFLPAIAAAWRSHRNCGAILALNLFLGWTFIGWVGALVWACTSNVDRGGQRRCPYCAEIVQAAAIKCRHCGSDMRAQQAS